MSLKYGIYLPKMPGDQALYSSVTIICIEDDVIIGAREYDFDGVSSVVPFLGLEYDARLTEHKTEVVEHYDGSFNSIREVWTFDDEQEAYVQKIILLKKMREYYNHYETQKRRAFDVKIPKEVQDTFDDLKENSPEFFL